MLYQLSYASLNPPETGPDASLLGRNCSRRISAQNSRLAQGLGGGKRYNEFQRASDGADAMTRFALALRSLW